MSTYSEDERRRAFAFIDTAIDECKIVTHNGHGYDAAIVDAMRGIVRMLQMQEEARALLAKIDKSSANPAKGE